jgi:hypothetical protein
MSDSEYDVTYFEEIKRKQKIKADLKVQILNLKPDGCDKESLNLIKKYYDVGMGHDYRINNIITLIVKSCDLVSIWELFDSSGHCHCHWMIRGILDKLNLKDDDDCGGGGGGSISHLYMFNKLYSYEPYQCVQYIPKMSDKFYKRFVELRVKKFELLDLYNQRPFEIKYENYPCNCQNNNNDKSDKNVTNCIFDIAMSYIDSSDNNIFEHITVPISEVKKLIYHIRNKKYVYNTTSPTYKQLCKIIDLDNYQEWTNDEWFSLCKYVSQAGIGGKKKSSLSLTDIKLKPYMMYLKKLKKQETAKVKRKILEVKPFLPFNTEFVVGCIKNGESIKYEYLETAGIAVDDTIINAFDTAGRKVYKKYMDNIKCTDLFKKERELSDKLLSYFNEAYFDHYEFDRIVKNGNITIDDTILRVLIKKINENENKHFRISYDGINHLITNYKLTPSKKQLETFLKMKGGGASILFNMYQTFASN